MGLDCSQWAHLLGALVTDKAQTAYQVLRRDDACNYEVIKVAILYRLEITLENYRLAFRACKSCNEWLSHVLLQCLRDLLNKWLLPTRYDQVRVIDKILLFLWDLEDDTQRWVRHHQSHNCQEALCLSEAFTVSKGEEGYGQGPKRKKKGPTKNSPAGCGLLLMWKARTYFKRVSLQPRVHRLDIVAYTVCQGSK